MERTRVHRLAQGYAALTAITYGLVVLGALVRAHGAGLACPDWPLCFGQVVPVFDVKVAFEYSHRALAGTLSLAFVALSWLCLRDPRTRAEAGRLVAIASALLAVQIVLGALTVWHLLASWTVTSHLVTGNAFALSLAFVARRLYRAGSDAPPRPSPHGNAGSVRVALYVAGALLALQVVLGGLVSSSYAGLACPDWPTCIDGEWFPSFAGARGAHLLHRLTAYALTIAIAVAAALGRGVPRLRGLLYGALVLVVGQVGVGVANVLLRLPVEVTGLHSALAAALVLTTSLALAESRERPNG